MQNIKVRTVYARISDIKAGISEDGVTLGNYSGKMAELGFNVLDMNGNLRDMGEVMEEIGGKWGDLTREQQISLAQTMAGQRQYNNLLALFDNFEEYNKALNTAQNAAGTLQEQQDIYMEQTAAHLQVLKASVEDIYDSLADNDGINNLIDELSTAAGFVADLVDSLGGGKAVLSSLGSIALTVFSNQIGASLATTINNLEKARFQAEQFRQAIEQAKKMQDQGLGDDYTRFLVGKSEDLLNMGGRLPENEFNAIQENLIQMSQNAGEIDVTREKIDLLGEAFNSVGLNFDEFKVSWGTLDDALASANGIEEIKDALKKLEGNFDPVIEKQKQARDAFKLMFQDIQKDSPNAAQSFDNFKEKLKDLIQTLKTTPIKETGEALFNSLPESAQKAVNEASQKLSEVKFGDPQKASNDITQIFATLNQTINGEIQKIKSLMESADKGELEGLQKKLEALQATQRNLEKNSDRMFGHAGEMLKKQDWVSLTGGIAQVGSAIQQIQNLGNIWKNKDLSTGQKILQIVTNLAISLPMLANGYTKIIEVLKLGTVVKLKDIAAAKAAILANGEHAVSFGVVGFAATQAGLKIQFFNRVLTLSPYAAAIGGAIALIAVLARVAAGYEAACLAAIKDDQATIEAENKKQEEIEKNKQLISSLQDLDEQYKNGEISRADLKSTIQDLIDQYGLEGKAADNLAHSYGNLADYIKQAREEAAQEAKESADRELAAARTEVTATAKSKVNDAGSQVGSDYFLNIGSGAAGAHGLFADEPKQIEQLLKDAGAVPDHSGNRSDFTFITDFDTKHIVDLYHTIQGIVDQVDKLREAGKLTDQQLQDSEYYQNMLAWLKQMKDSVEHYQDALKDVSKYSTELTAITAEGTGKVDFSDVQNANQYLEQRLALIQQIQAMLDKKGDTTADAAEMADTYLRDNFRTLYTQYSDAADYIEQIRKKFGEANASVEQMISDMDEDHLGMLMKLDPSTIKDWDTLAGIIQRIAGIDLSYTASAIALDPESVQAAASDKYNIYQSLEDQVSGGKSISKEEMESLDPEIQKLFSMMANGTFKMTGDAEEFYNKVNSFKLDGFFDTLDAINRELEKNQALQDKNFNYDALDQSANTTQYISGGGRADFIDYDLVKYQLDYLQTVTDTNSELGAQIDLWIELAKNQELNKEQVDAIAEAIGDAKDQTANLTERQKELNEIADEVAHQLHDAMFPTDSDVDTKVLENLSETIQDIADESDELDNNLTEDSRAADDVAESILRYDDAIEDVVDNYEDWMAALNSGSIQEQAEVIDDLRDAYADLLDLDGSALSNDFLTNAENLDLMKAAIDGDIDAYDELLSRAGQDIAATVHLDTTEFQTNFDHLMDLYYQGQNLEDMEIGASLNNQDFLDGLSQMVTAAGMTAQQATDYLASMGVDAEVVEQKTEGTEKKQITGYHGEPNNTQIPYDYVYMDGTSLEHYKGNIIAPGVKFVPDTETVTDTKENSVFGLKVISAHKSSGGNFKFSQAKNGGGSKGASRRSGGGSGGKGRGGGGKGRGGGGKGKAQEPDTSQKDPKKSMKDTRDIYHDINIELKQINKQLDRVQKKQDRLYGKQLLDNLKEQSKILDQHKAKLEEKHELQKQDLASQQQTLKNLGVTFDKYGNISNYMDILANKQAQVNAKTKQYNSLIEAYNKSTDKDIKKQISEEAEKLNKQIKEYEDEYKDLEDKIKNYDGLREDMEDLVDQIEEETQKQIEINIKKFRMEVEIRLDMGEAERDWNKFRREVLEHTDIIKDTDFQEIFSDAAQGTRDITSYFNVRGSKGSLQTLTEQLMDTRAEIEAIDKTGSSAIYGDNKAQAMEDLQNDLKELMEQMEDIQELIDDVDKAYLDTIEDVEEQFDKQIEDYEYVGELIEHDIDLLSLLYGDRNYDAMNKYYETLERNNLKQLDSLKRQRDFWKEQWDAAVARGDTQAAKQFEENYKETIKNLNETIEEAAKNLQNKYINAIDKIFDELDKKISNGKGTDYLNTEWELMNKNADEYLDTINTAFAIQETERKYQKALDETKSIKNQQALKKLMDEQLGILKNKEKVTQYDVDRAEKLLQVEQARIALQDAQSAKTSMRLKRDSQGNYSYEYVADNGAVDDAQANLAQAQNDLYNFDKERYQSNLDDMLSAWRDFQSDYKDILEDTSLTEQERIEKLALLREQYGEYINDKTAENLVVRNNLMESAFADLAALYNTDVENYNQMSIDEQNILMGDLVPAWESGIQQMADKVAGEGGFIPVCEDAFNDITEKTKEYEEQLDNMANAAGVSLDYVTQGIDLLSDAFMDLVEDNDELVDRMYTEVDAIKTLQDAARELVNEYQNIYNEAKTAVSEIHDFIQQEQGRAAAYVETADVAINSYNRTAKAYTDAYNQMASAFQDYAARVRAAASGDGSGDGGGSSGSGSGGSGSSSGSGSQRATSTATRRRTGGCFSAGTKIIMADNSVKNIEDVQIHDMVIAYNDKEKQYELREVTKTFVHPDTYAIVEITLSNGIVMSMTPGHPILTTEGWKSLDLDNSAYEHGVETTLLNINDEVLGYNGNAFVTKIVNIDIPTNYTVYNLEVESCHTFLANGMVVHNTKAIGTYASGGYTGDWNSDQGRIAILHEKELVLNKDDTKNFLDGIKILRHIASGVQSSLSAKTENMNIKSLMNNENPDRNQIDQNVQIEATFPNVNSKREIEEAFNDLVNLAAQRAMRR